MMSHARRRKVLFAHQFSLSSVTGVTVTLVDLLRQFPLDDGTEAAYLSFEGLETPADLTTALSRLHPDIDCIVGINLHIEVGWAFSVALFAWCRENGVTPYVYVVDYWPHHHDGLEHMVATYGVRILAATPFLHASLAHAGFDAALLQTGVPFLNGAGAPAQSAAPASKEIASIARLGARKRLPDVVRAFALADPGPGVELYLKVLPTHTFGSTDDAEEMALIEREIRDASVPAGSVRIDRVPTVPQDYGRFFVYVCPSSYEGFSLSPIQAAYAGCPPLLSDIPPHRLTAEILFGERAADVLFPVGDQAALAALLRDELRSGRRRALVRDTLASIRAAIDSRYSMATMARAFASRCTESDA